MMREDVSMPCHDHTNGISSRATSSLDVSQSRSPASRMPAVGRSPGWRSHEVLGAGSMSPRLSPTPRDKAQLAATCRYRVDGPRRKQVVENSAYGGNRRRELSIQRSRVQISSSPPFNRGVTRGRRQSPPSLCSSTVPCCPLSAGHARDFSPHSAA